MKNCETDSYSLLDRIYMIDKIYMSIMFIL